MVGCGGGVVVMAVCNVVAVYDVSMTDGVAVADGVVVAVGVVDGVDVWVQQCQMRACTNLQSDLVSTVVTLRGNKSPWCYRQTTQGPHSTMERLVCCQTGC